MDGQNVILIGFMGAGKTSVGEELARRHHRVLLDTDRLIEQQAGMDISGIFETVGEDAFRRLETDVLEELLSKAEGETISVGGGLPLREENRRLLKQLGTVVYLRVRPETVLTRLRGDTTRPLLMGDDVEEKVNSLLDYRGPIYEAAAHRIISVDGKTVEEIANEIMAGIADEIVGDYD